ncbi:MAG: GntR family transcriptional regulator [Fimbriimonas sp.]|nr:GntR family transcriptional regulator [Fimbriimonas sp.]
MRQKAKRKNRNVKHEGTPSSPATGKSSTKHSAVAEALREEIRNGAWEPGDRIPSEKVLAEKYGVAYMTARQAVSSLVADGTLERIARKGTYLAGGQPIFKPAGRNHFVLLVEGGKTSLDPYYLPPIVEAFGKEISSSGYELSVYGYSVEVLDRLVTKDVLVCCILLSEQDVVYAKLLRERGNQVYAINRCKFGGFVAANNVGGAEIAVNHLASLGHRRIGFVRGLPGNLDAGERRLGYVQGMMANGLRPGPEEGDHFVERCGHESAAKMLASENPPTAIFCASDLSAIGAMKAVAEAGLSVPQDISVVGFGDFPLAQYLHPGLTTIRLPIPDLGTEAARQMLAMAEGRAAADVVLPCELVVRDTTGDVAKELAKASAV